MAKLKSVFILSENPAALGQLAAAAREIGESVSAVLIGRGQEKQVIEGGADRVYLLPEGQGQIVEDYVPSIQKLIADEKPQAVLVRTSRKGRLIAGRLAAASGTSVLADTSRLWVENDSLHSARMVYGGAAIRVERAKGPVTVALVGDGLYEPLKPDAGRKGDVVEVPFVQPARRATLVESRPKGGESVNLAAAKKIVCIGRGLAKQEDLSLIEDLAKTLGAEVGCTRPITEGVNWLPRERYIGVSGVMVKPDVAFVIGISGQIQFTVGVNTARTIIAINNDKNAPIFKSADYGIVGDLYTVVPALADKLKG
ncbi:MAG: FAD-binding protein [Synergistaceae bacterium]|jgi:electron transfer flavoprotein alpha subunit|nr:FAD-binding protein [Synergistaceae bacterium]